MTFSSTDEARRYGGPIIRLFRTGLNRAPDAAALRTFVGSHRAGAGLVDLARSIAGSPEFERLHGPDAPPDDAFVTRLFRFALDREPDGEGLAGWRRAAAEGAGRAEFLVAVAESDEAKARLDVAANLFPDGIPVDDDLGYQFWLERHGEPDATDRAAIARHIDRLAARPRISLLMLGPTGRPDLALETLASLEGQLYPDWEVCVTCGPGVPPAVVRALEGARRRVPGVVLVPVDDASGVGRRWGAALAASSGAFVAFLDAGDRLAATALYEVAAELERHPDLLLVYTDEDRIDGLGRRSRPSFKPGWGPDMLLHGDAIGQLAVIRRTRLDQVGGPRDDVGPLVRYDLLLRVCEALHPSAVGHVPVPLFHRGRVPGRPLPFPEARTTGLHPGIRRVVDRHLREVATPGPRVTLEDTYLAGGVWPRAVVEPPDPLPPVSVIVPTHNQPALLGRCMEGLLGRTAYPDLEVLVADHANTELEARELLRRLGRDPRVSVHPVEGPSNRSAINNAMARLARGEILVLLHDDTDVIDPGWLGELVAQLGRPRVGIAGARLLYPDGTLEHGGVVLGRRRVTHVLRSARGEPGYLGQIALARDLSAVTGACLAIRRAVFEEIGGLDPRLEVAGNDVDLCLRARARGYRVVWTPHALLAHPDGASRGRDDTRRRRARFDREMGLLQLAWPDAMANDPFLNPNLEATDHHFRLATPPRRVPPWRGGTDGERAAP